MKSRRFVGAAIGVIGLFATWRLGRHLGGPLAGLIALLLLATCPLYYGHMFMNAKDAPFAVAMAIGLFGIVRALQEYPRASLATVTICSVGVGLAIGSRVFGGFILFDALLPLLFIVAVEARDIGRKAALRECGAFLAPFIPGAILAYFVMALVWPWAVVAPLNPLRAVEYFSGFFERPWRELFDGQLILVPDMPRSYLPTLAVLTLPELMMAFGVCGIIGAIVVCVRSDLKHPRASVGTRTALLAVVLAAVLPILVTVATRPAMYNGIRHFVFLTPPFAVLGGLAAAWIAQRLRAHGRLAMVAGTVVLISGLTSSVVEMVRLHPYEYTSFNHIAGGVAAARAKYMIDYWGLSMRQASLELRTRLAETGEKPTGEKWIVALCGPRPPVAVSLGPQYSVIWDPKGADFAMMLGEFYCAKLDAPIFVEIVREGVVYARVYDIRGRAIPSLLTVKGPDS